MANSVPAFKTKEDLITESKLRSTQRLTMLFDAQSWIYGRWQKGEFGEKSPRMSYCRRHTGAGFKNPVLVPTKNPHYSGFAVCGSFYCPICQAGLQRHRRLAIQAGLQPVIDDGKSLLFVTLTLRHDASHSLEQSLEALRYGWNQLKDLRTKAVKVERSILGMTGQFVRTIEVTHGRNGFHPHIHAAFVINTANGADETMAHAAAAKRLEAEFFRVWAAAAEKKGMPQPSQQRGVDFAFWEGDHSNLSAYLAKAVGQELTGSEYKTSRASGWHKTKTMWEVLSLASDSDSSAKTALHYQKVYLEYITSCAGLKWVSASPGFIPRLADVPKVDPDDEDLEPEPERLVILSSSIGVKKHSPGLLLGGLKVASEQGPGAVVSFFQANDFYAQLGKWSDARKPEHPSN